MASRAWILALGGLAALALLSWLSSPAEQVEPPTRHPGNRMPARVAVAPEAAGLPIRSMLNIRRRMHYGQFAWDEAGVRQGRIWIRIDLGAQLVSVFRAGHEIGTAVILYGADAKPTPPGRYPVLEKRKQHRSNLYDAEMPYMVRLTNDGIAIHASEVRPGAATHGCIGVPTEFAKRLFETVRVGDEVVVIA